MILALALTAMFGATTPATGDFTTVHLVNNTGSQALSIRIDGRVGCRATPKGGDCSFEAPVGFHHFSVAANSGPAMEKALYIAVDNNFVWTVEGKDLPGASRWSVANNDKPVCKMRLTVAGISQRVCIPKKAWDAENTIVRQEMMVSQRAFCGGGTSC